MTVVVNRWNEPFDILIDRSTIFGNPFFIGVGGCNRKGAIGNYKIYFYDRIKNDEDFRKKVLTLCGKRLGCHCKPLACHGDVIAEYLNNLSTTSRLKP